MISFVLVCLIVCSGLLLERIKVGGGVGESFLYSPSPRLHHYSYNQINMSSPIAFPFSFKEDACAQDVVDSMEQVGGLF